MSDPKISNGEAKRLTLDDPVSPETLQSFGQIKEAQIDVALELMAVEERKIQLLAANKKLREQNDRLFQSILIERGQPPHAGAELDSKTGKIVLLQPAKPPAVEPPAS